MLKIRNYLFLTVCILLAAGLYSCKTAEQMTGERPAETGPASGADSARTAAASPAEEFNLADYRNTLADVYSTQQHDLPEAFLRTYKGDQPVERDPFDGFRIQIASTRNVALADSTAKKFRLWADTTFTGYQPETYVFFKQPYYKVHVGDFHVRERANRVSRLVKRQYPDAWVVHDRINPYLVPADTARIELRKD